MENGTTEVEKSESSLKTRLTKETIHYKVWKLDNLKIKKPEGLKKEFIELSFKLEPKSQKVLRSKKVKLATPFSTSGSASLS